MKMLYRASCGEKKSTAFAAVCVARALARERHNAVSDKPKALRRSQVFR